MFSLHDMLAWMPLGAVLWGLCWLAEPVRAREQDSAAQDLVAVDPQMATTQPGDNLLWYDIQELGVEGRGWSDTKEFYDRLPARAEGRVRPPVWDLSKHSAGLSVRFVTDAPTLAARWTLRFESLAMNHMPATGVSGLDLYGRELFPGPAGRWHWVGVGRPEKFPTNQQTLVSGLAPGTREYRLYLPLYNGVRAVQIGIPPGAKLFKAPPYPPGRARPILFYGTSITQGGCASRPGMAYPAILGRWLDRPTLNLGFSGNGQMEPEVVQLLAELDPCVYVIDCLPNLSPSLVTERTEPLVETLRRAHPETPIVLVENIVYQNAALVPGNRQGYRAKNEALRAAYGRLVAGGVQHLYCVPGDTLLGEDGEATVDGSHPTDVGFLRLAQALEPVLRAILDQPF
jgi:lysophospholipase L1-like esterase